MDPAPLNPYGYTGPTQVDSRWSREYQDAAMERARYKVSHRTMEAPVGPDGAYQVYAWLNLGIGLLWLAAMLIAASATKGNFVGGCIWPLILIAGSSYWFKWHKNSNPTQPERAVQAWIGAITRKKWERIDRLRVDTDRDNFPRRLPEGEGALELPMGTVSHIEAYWKELRRRAGLHRGRWTLKKPEVRYINNSMATVELQLSAPRLPQWWALVSLAVFLGALFAMIFYVVQSKKSPDWLAAIPLVLLVMLVVLLVIVGWRRKHRIKKVVVYNDNEWRLVSGEWQAPEDLDTRWLQEWNKP